MAKKLKEQVVEEPQGESQVESSETPVMEEAHVNPLQRIKDAADKINNDAVRVILEHPYSVQPGSDAEARLLYLAAQPQVPVFVPTESGEKAGTVVIPVIGNGLRINILKGIPANVPSDIAQDLMNAFYQTQKALEGNGHKVDSNFLK